MSKKNIQKSSLKGFTLIELLIVIAILAVLMSVIVITLNPSEMLKKSRDSRRLSDLAALRTALNLYLSEDYNFSGYTTYAYLSVPLASAGTCGSYGGRTAYCAALSNYRTIGTTGWLPINFSVLTLRSPISALPIDPTNSTSSGYYYVFAASSSLTTYELNANLESSAYASLETTDGGNNSTIYEIGSDLSILN
ncbi:MAG: type II secretion system protein [Minisyncoccia bacterium]